MNTLVLCFKLVDLLLWWYCSSTIDLATKTPCWNLRKHALNVDPLVMVAFANQWYLGKTMLENVSSPLQKVSSNSGSNILECQRISACEMVWNLTSFTTAFIMGFCANRDNWDGKCDERAAIGIAVHVLNHQMEYRVSFHLCSLQKEKRWFVALRVYLQGWFLVDQLPLTSQAVKLTNQHGFYGIWGN